MSLLDDLLLGFDEALDWPLDPAGEPDEGSFEGGPDRLPPTWGPAG